MSSPTTAHNQTSPGYSLRLSPSRKRYCGICRRLSAKERTIHPLHSVQDIIYLLVTTKLGQRHFPSSSSVCVVTRWQPQSFEKLHIPSKPIINDSRTARKCSLDLIMSNAYWKSIKCQLNGHIDNQYIFRLRKEYLRSRNPLFRILHAKNQWVLKYDLNPLCQKCTFVAFDLWLFWDPSF